MSSKNAIKIYIKDGIYHIYNRGVEKRIIFLDEQDYRIFLYYLKTYLTPIEFQDKPPKNIKYLKHELDKKIKLFCYCLMPNHFHLMVKQLTDRAIVEFMKRITNAYTEYFNKKYERVGGLFQGCYKAVLIDKENYFWELARYIDLNALKANLVKKIENYRWSSFRVYVKIKNEFPEGLIDKERFLQYWDERGDIEKARKNYLQFVRDGIEIIKMKKEPCFISDKKFV